MNRRAFAIIAPLLARLAVAQGTWFHLDTSNTHLESNVVNFLAFDKAGNLWTANEMNGQEGLGLFRFDGSTWTKYDALDCAALSSGIRSAASDTAGNMWFGSYDQGLVKYDGTDWTVYDTGNSGLPSDMIMPVAVDEDNVIWVGSWEGGLSRFDGSTWTNWDSNNAPFYSDEQCIHSIEFYGGRVWVGLSCGAGLHNYDPATDSWTTIAGLPHPYISALKNDGQGNLWVGYSYWGYMISRFDGISWTDFYPFPSAYHGVQANSFAVDLAGRPWCSAIGLWYFDDPDWWVHDAPLPIDGAGTPNQNIAIGPDGAIWWAEYNGIWTNDHRLTNAIAEPGMGPGSLMIFPNPAHAVVTIDLPPGMRSGTMRLFDAQGAIVREMRIAQGVQATIARDGLSSGAYSVILLSDEGNQAAGRVIFE